MNYVIIGNSAAAIGAVEGIRKVDPSGKITLISDEPYHTYSRPLISYYLSGKVSEDKMLYRDGDFYNRNQVTTKLGTKVIGLKIEEKQVELESGELIPYDKLLIATGGKPFVPNIEGLDKEGIFTFLKFDDVKALEKVAFAGSKAVIVGAGLIGLKAAEALVKKGVEVKVVELSNRVLSAILDEEAAELVQNHLEDQEVEFHLNTTVSEVLGNGKVSGVKLQNGESLECDYLIVAIGVVPNTDLVINTSISVNRGIVVNKRMETNLTGIYAAGDVSEGYDLVYDSQRVIPILPNAYRQGETAGVNMAGENSTYSDGFAKNAIGFFDLPMVTAGIIKPEGQEFETIVVSDQNKPVYKKMILKNNKLVGFIFLNEIDRAGIYTKFISEKTNVKDYKELLLTKGVGYALFPERLVENKVLRGVKVNEHDFM